MKKFMVAFVMFVTIIGVTVMGPKEAFAQTADTVDENALTMSDLHRAERILDELKWYVEANPNWNEKIVRLMITQEESGVKVATTWINDGEWYSSTSYLSHEDILELDVWTMFVCAQARIAGVWMD